MFARLLPALALLPFISGKVIDVIVGGPGKLFYSPQYVHAQVHDVVRFHFRVKAHTVTQSSFERPCTKIGHGFDSGFRPVADTQTDNFPTFDVKVTSKKPVWAYCQQVNHCSQGMVFAINPPSHGNTFAAFRHRALATASKRSEAPEPRNNHHTHHHIVVGGAAGNVYTPNNIHAKVGDTVTFEFRQKNHTLTQSSFDDPCRKLEFTHPGQIGFDSGFKPVPAEQTSGFPTWTLKVKNETPVWAYCQQTAHCGQGMVFAVNAPTSGAHTFDNFRANAIRINGTVTAP